MPDQARNVVIIGATGAVGEELCSLIDEREWAIADLRLTASTDSVGTIIQCRGTDHCVTALTESTLDGADIVLCAAGADVSRIWAPRAVAAGAIVIDNSSAFRTDPNVPLVVPEVNGADLDDCAPPCIIANPNCTTIITLLAVHPLHAAFGVERMVVSTYQAASGGGRAMMEELEQQARDFVAGKPLRHPIAGRPCLFNVFCHESAVDDDGMNVEERKLINESHRMLHDDTIGITGTCVRVPVLRAHSAAVNLTLRSPASLDEIRAAIDAAPGVRVVDDRETSRFPEPIDASGIDDILVGRLRPDPSQPDGFGVSLFVSGDQLRKGAALNAVQLAECVVASTQPARS